MNILNLKSAVFLFIVGLSYCLPIFIFADCKDSFRKPYVTAEKLPSVEEFRQRVIVDKEIKNQGQYNRHRRTDPELKRFPFSPEKRYPAFQWPGRNVTAEKLPSEAEFRLVVVVDKEIKNQGQYTRHRRTDPELKRFPFSPEKDIPPFNGQKEERAVVIVL